MPAQTPAEPDATYAPTSMSDLEKKIAHVEADPVDSLSSDLETVGSSQDGDDRFVHWDGPSDPLNALNWSSARKWVTIALISLSSFNVSMVSTIFAPGVPQVLAEFHNSNPSMESLIVSIYVMGAAIGPLVLTPITEVSGRLPVTHAANLLFVAAASVCAASINLPMLILSRLVMGLASSVPVTVGGGFVADMMPMEERGTAMTVWTVGPLMGFVSGPIFGGFMVESIGWRWTVWLEAILGGFIAIISIIFLRETYAPVILQRRAMELEKATGHRYKTKYDTDKTFGYMLMQSLKRPMKFLVLSPNVLIVSLYSAVTYSYMYVLFTTFTSIFEKVYNFTPGQAGLGYLGLGLGFIVGQVTVGLYSDSHLKRQEQRYGKMTPEHRLPPLVLGCALVPIGLFWYGWTAEYHLHWMVPITGTFFLGAGLYYVHLSTQVYLVDAYPLYAASAVSAELALRSVFGAVVPLAGPPLYAKLGLGWGNSLLGFIAVGFAPSSYFLLRYGERIRLNPRFQPRIE
ncbi:synaptic vesicle transporter [Aspergillus taichungensis]|uniref:Synaptic vesicle transporter n=1 Tax=Aspergillus taichungensis TaxID=482145 RepID=A0A2J5HGC5_9EURO|nr:synaptic vesicle transporter [Aspergillus taichungensis]